MNINHLAVLVTVVAAQVLGYLWYSVLFGKLWAPGYRLESDVMAQVNPAYVGFTFAGSIAFGYAMAIGFALSGVTGVASGLGAATLVIVGFVLPRYLLHAIFARVATKSILIDLGFDLVVTLVTGVIIGGWIA